VLFGLLKAPTQDGDVCQLVTVATGTAASAAADLVASGDYAVAYPDARILFHGTRQRSPQVLTKESAAMMVQSLKDTNEGFALELAERAFSRFFFRYIMLKSHFDDVRKSVHPAEITDVGCLAELLQIRAMGHASIPQIALENYVTNRWPTSREFKTAADFEAFILRCIISYERREKKSSPDWAFSDDGLVQMQEDFMVMRDYRTGQHNRNLETQVQRWGAICLGPSEQTEFSSVESAKRDEWLAERTGERVRALRYFFISMCRALQEGENFLSGEEAYWLGVIDEVAGRTDLPCMRVVMENSPKSGHIWPSESKEAESGTVEAG
jgi:hypothetical protein